MPVQIKNLAELSAAETIRREMLNRQLLKTVGNDAMLGLGLGAGGIGLYQLAKLLIPARKGPDTESLEPPKIHVKKHDTQYKSAGLYRLINDLRGNKRAVPTHVDKIANIFGAVKAGVTGQAADSVNALPYGLSARAVALLAGLGGGAYLTKRLGANAKEHALNQELEQARSEFEQALNETSSPQTKLASAINRIESAMSLLSSRPSSKLDKQAADGLANNLGKALSVYALLALLSGGTAGYYGYKAGVKNQKSRRYELANAARQQRRKLENPYRPVAVLDTEEDENSGAGPASFY
jgi:hypothetical protein